MTLDETVQALADKGPRCPECYGDGYSTHYYYDTGYDTHQAERMTCQVCSGLGSVLDPFTNAIVSALQEVPF